MKIDSSYEDLFSSLGVAIVICILVVSIGKSVTHYYFVYIVVFLLLLITILAVYDYCNCKVETIHLEKAEYFPLSTPANIKRKSNKCRVFFANKPSLSSNQSSSPNKDKVPRLRRRAYSNKEDGNPWRTTDITQRLSPTLKSTLKKRQWYIAQKHDSLKSSDDQKSLSKRSSDDQKFLSRRSKDFHILRKTNVSLIKEEE